MELEGGGCRQSPEIDRAPAERCSEPTCLTAACPWLALSRHPRLVSLGGGGGQGHLTRWAAASCWVQMPVLTDHPAVRIPAGTGSTPVSHVQIIRAGGLSPGFTSEAAGLMGVLAPGTAPAAASPATSVALRGRVTRPRGGQLRDVPRAPWAPRLTLL